MRIGILGSGNIGAATGRALVRSILASREPMTRSSRRFNPDVVDSLREAKYLRIRSGKGTHRFTGIWVIVVDGRVFVRSWSLKPGGWYRTLLEKPQGTILVGEREFPVRAVAVHGERVTAAIDRAYLEKYATPGSVPYARGLGEGARRATTTELVPDAPVATKRRRKTDVGQGKRSSRSA
jgi:hypothetical protein